MDNSDYKSISTYKVNDIKNGDYILYNGEVYKIHLKKIQGCKKIYTHITCQCYDFMKNKYEYIQFKIDEDFRDYVKFKQEVSKIIFTIKNATFIDYNDNVLSLLDEEGNIVNIKYDNYKANEDDIIKYIKFGENYKVIK